jgi:hypothetical protein
VSGICDDPTTINNFNQLAKNMKQSANLSGVSLQLQLALEGVICLLHPKNNTDDFITPLLLDGSYLIGQDTLADPNDSQDNHHTQLIINQIGYQAQIVHNSLVLVLIA